MCSSDLLPIHRVQISKISPDWEEYNSVGFQGSSNCSAQCIHLVPVSEFVARPQTCLTWHVHIIYFLYMHIGTSSHHMVSTQHYDALSSTSSRFLSDENFGIPDIENVMNNVFGSRDDGFCPSPVAEPVFPRLHV